MKRVFHTISAVGKKAFLLFFLLNFVFSPTFENILRSSNLSASLAARIAEAAFNQQINYQGKLTDTSNVSVSNGSYNMEFKLYTSLTGGSPIWTETWCKGTSCSGTGTDNRITVTSGLFSTMLGSTTALTSVDFNQPLYLSINIGGSGNTPSWDGEMSPRKILGAVPAAFEAKRLNGLNDTQFLRTDTNNSTSSASTFITLTQSGAGNILNLVGQSSASVFTALSSGNVGIGTTSPGQKLSVAGDILGNNIIGSYFTATTSTASVFPYASTTALTISGTNGLQLATGLNGPLQANAGLVSATTSIGVVYGGTGLQSVASSSILLGTGGNTLLAVATSSLGLLGSSVTSSLTSSYVPKWGGSAFSNSNLYDDGTNIGIGTASPSAKLEVNGAAKASVFTSNAYNSADNSISLISFDGGTTNRVYDGLGIVRITLPGTTGYVGISTTSPWRAFSVNGSSDLGTNALAGYFTATTSTASVFPYASSTALTVSGTNGLQLATGLNGPLQANAGLVSATTSVGVLYGGTGLTSVASSSILLGTGGNSLLAVATSSLGLLGSAVTSALTPSYVPKWGGSAFSNSNIYDDGTNVGIGTTTNLSKFTVNGAIRLNSASDPGDYFYTSAISSDGRIEFRSADGGLNSNGGNQRIFMASGYSSGCVGLGPNDTNASLSCGGSTGNSIVVTPTALSMTAVTIGGIQGTGTHKSLQISTPYSTNSIATSSTQMIDISTLSNVGNANVGQRPGIHFTALQYAFGVGDGSPLGAGDGYSTRALTIASSTEVGIGTSTPWGKLSVTNTGSGPSFVVEDDTSPDSTPFIIDASGNVGIGTASPANTSTNSKLDLYRASTVALGLKSDVGGDWRIGTNEFNNGDFAISSASVGGSTYTGRLILNTAGNVGIGTTSPGQKLSVAGDILGNNIIGSYFTSTSTTASTFAGAVKGTSDAFIAYQSYIGNTSYSALSGDVGAGPGLKVVYTGGTTNLYGSVYNTAEAMQLQVAGSEKLRITTTGNVGIGSTSPATTLSVAGSAYVTTGLGVGKVNTTANSVDVAIGTNSEPGTYKINGANMLSASTTLSNYFVGAKPPNLYTTLTGDDNIGIGRTVFQSNTSGYDNVAIGNDSLYYNTTGHDNVSVGHYNLLYNTIGDYNTAIGRGALTANTEGDGNTAVGSSALAANNTGYSNTAIGRSALPSNTTGYYNVAIGQQALNSNQTGNDNIAIGVQAGYGVTGTKNILIGPSYIEASYNQVTTGSQNIAIGYDVAVPDRTASYQLSIGNLIYGTGLDGAGSTVSTGKIGIGTTSPAAKLTVLSTTEQLRLNYDQSNYASFTVGSTGNLTINPTGGQTTLAYASTTQIGSTNAAYFATSAGNVGIGSTSPATKLGVTGSGYFTGGLGVGKLNTTAGYVDVSTTGGYAFGGVDLGVYASSTNTSVFGIGDSYTGYSPTAGQGIKNLSNVALTLVGPRTGADIKNGASYSVFVGSHASGCCGYGPGSSAGSHTGSVGIGAGALLAVGNAGTTSDAIAIGKETLQFGGTVTASVALGYGAGSGSATAEDVFNYNVAIGQTALGGLVGADSITDSVAIGYLAGSKNATSSKNIFIGSNSGYTCCGGTRSTNNNIFVGYGTGILATGNNNLFLGHQAGDSDTSGSSNIVIGYQIDSVSPTDSNQLNIASLIYGTSTNSNGLIGIGTTTPTAKLSIKGNGSSGRAFALSNSSGAEKFTILDDGTTGIGSTSPSTTFGVVGSGYFTTGLGAGVLETTAGRITSNTGFNVSTNATTSVLRSNGTVIMRTRGGDTQSGSYSLPNNIGLGTGAGAAWNGDGYLNVAIGYNAMNVATSAAANVAIGPSALASLINGNNNVGIGNGALQANTTGSNNAAVGTQALQLSTTGGSNSAFGFAAMAGAVTGSNNVAFGSSAGRTITSGTSNTCIGNASCYGGLLALTTGSYNVAIGDSAGSDGSYSIGIGQNTLSRNSGTGNIAIGTGALNGSGSATVTGNYNTAIGGSALSKLTTGGYNVVIGQSAFVENRTGVENVGIGYSAMRFNSSATTSVAIGAYAGYGSAETGYSSQDSTYVGYQSGYAVATGSNANTFLGTYSGISNTSGANNTLIGFRAGDSITTGSNNLLLGYDIDGLSTGSNNIIIGYNIDATSTGSVGGLNIGNSLFGANIDSTGTTVDANAVIGIGTSTPSARFSITSSGTGTGRAFAVANSSDAEKFTILDNGSVGIGTTSPAATLSVAGSAYITTGLGVGKLNTTANTIDVASGGKYMYNGTNLIVASTTLRNTFVGQTSGAGFSTTLTGTANNSFGYNNLSSLTTGTANNVFGDQAGIGLTTGNYNNLMGQLAGSVITTGSGNVAIGNQALYQATSSSYNTAIGYSAMGGQGTTDHSGVRNVAIGAGSLANWTSGSDNIAIGAAGDLSNGPLVSNTSGSYNIALGYQALQVNTTSSNNVSIGYRSGQQTTGGSNTYLGYFAGYTNVAGAGNTFIGLGADAASSGLNYATALGYSAIAGCSNCLVLGGTGATYGVNVGIGTTTPYAKLSIQGETAASTTLAIIPKGSQTANILDIYSNAATPVLNSVITAAGKWGIGTTSPYAALSVVGSTGVVAQMYTATSTTATSTFAGGLDVGSGALTYDFSSGVTSISNLELGAMNFDTNAGAVSWADMPVTSAASAGTVESYSAQVDGTAILTVYSESDGAGGIQNKRVGVNNAAPGYGLSVVGTVAFSGLTADTAGSVVVCMDPTTKQLYEAAGTTCTGSSIRFKKNVESLASGLDVVRRLRPVSFDLKKNNEPHLGLIAEEVYLVEPRLTFTEQASTTLHGVRYEELTAVLTKAIQELATTTAFIANNYASTTPIFTVDANGNVGIGTTTPAYALQVMGDVAATSFVNVSTRDAKRDITYLSATDSEQVLQKIKGMKVATYHYLNESTTNPLRLGLIAEEAPIEVLSATGKGVDVYKLATFILAGVQAQQIKIEALESRVARLEATGVSGSTGSTGGVSVATVLSSLEQLGSTFSSALAQFKKAIAESLTVGSAAKPSGITLYDEVTKAPYCLKMVNGVMTSVVGECATVSVEPATAPAPTSPAPAGATEPAPTAPADTQPPVITVNGNNPATIEKNASYLDLGVTVTDNVSQNIGHQTTGDQIDTSIPGTYTVTYTATDVAGNTTTATRTVVVTDPAAPVDPSPADPAPAPVPESTTPPAEVAPPVDTAPVESSTASGN